MSNAVKVRQRRLKKLVSDPVKSAEAVNLVYVNDSQPGIIRLGAPGNFTYKQNGRTIANKTVLDRIRKLVIPPAWQNVWICPLPNGHIQVTGTDVRGRKQYKYHPHWNMLRNHTKFSQLLEFGKALPQIRQKLNEHLATSGLNINKVLAAAVSIMQCTCIRVGNNAYEKLYGSFGLTTLKDQHVQFNGHNIKFSFKGKKGIYHSLSLKSRKLANIVKQCRDIPGKELFQYYDQNGQRSCIDSGMVNNYIKEISGGNFTAKDFRTWAGSLKALSAFKELGEANSITQIKKKIVEALDQVASHLGNTRTVCKKYYVHPSIIDRYSDSTLMKMISSHAGAVATCKGDVDLNEEEHLLLKVLEKGNTDLIIQ
jgi:DNA topoisomerase I